MLAMQRSTYDPSARGPDAGTSRHTARNSLVAIVLAILGLALMGTAAPAASAAPWSCSSFGYLFQSPDPAGFPPPHDIVQVDLATGAQTKIGETPNPTNGVGFNELDGFFYGIQAFQTSPTTSSWSLVRIHSDGHIDDLGQPSGPGGTMTPIANFPIGDVDSNGHYWTLNQAADTWYEVDLTTPTPTLLRQGPVTLPPGIPAVGNDWSWVNGALYMPSFLASDGKTHLVRFTPATGFQDLGPIAIPNAGIGATFVDSAGYLYASQNTTGIVYRVDLATRQTIALPAGNPSPGNDGARCASAVIPTITVTKTVGGRVRSADQFTVGLVDDTGRQLDSATTSGTGTSASTTNWPVSQGKTYTITDAMAGGSASPLSEYVQSISCKDSAGNTVPTGGSAPRWTLTVADATYYTCNVTNKAQADLEIDKTATPTPAVPGTNETYSLTVTNHGPSTASNVSVSDPLPSKLSFVSASSGCGEANGTVTCTLASLAPGASHTFTVTAKIASSADSCADMRNTATVSSDIVDNDLSNNSSTYCPPLKGKADLSITKVASQTQVAPGGQVMYTLVVHNDGPSDATGVTVVDPLAAGLSLVSAAPSQGFCSTAGGKLSCNLGSLKADGSAQVLVTTRATAAPGPCATSSIRNTSTVSGDQQDPDLSNNSASASTCPVPGPEPRFDLVVTKTANHKTVYVGQPLRYTITVTNNGPDAAPSADVTDTLNTHRTLVSVKTSQGSCTKQIPMTCQLGTIPAGGKVTIQVTVKLREAGCRQRNAASTTGDGTDTNPANNLARVDVCAKHVRLRLTKVANHHSVQAGGRLTYRIRVSNPTAGEARKVQVCDNLPSGMVYVSSKAKAKLTKGRYCWKLKRLGAHKHHSYRITVRLLRGAHGNKVNRATATGAQARTARAKRTVRVLGAQVLGGGVTG